MGNIIDKIKISGTSYDLKDKNAPGVSGVTQAQYDALPESAKTSNTLFVITDAQAGDLSNYWTSAETQSAITQAVSGKASQSDLETVSGQVAANTSDISTVSASTASNTTALGGLSLVKLTQSEYDALDPNYDSNTLYVIVN